MTDGYTQRQGRTCTTPGCTRTTVPPQPKCSMHAALAAKQHRDAHAYYSTAHWRKLRERRRDLDYRQCVVCTSRERLMCHHIKPRKDGGDDSIENTTTLCHSCHSRLERGDQRTIDLLAEHLRYRPM